MVDCGPWTNTHMENFYVNFMRVEKRRNSICKYVLLTHTYVPLTHTSNVRYNIITLDSE